MTKNLKALKQKVQFLEKELKQKDRLLKTYKASLTHSNIQIKRITKDLKENLSLIREIHKNLLPVKLPNISGFEFSYKFSPTRQAVSGDFFDIIKIDNSRSFGMLLSSCHSYAITSLFVSAFLKFSPHIRKCKTARDFVSFFASQIKSSLTNGKEKIHLFYGVVSRNSLEMNYFLTGDIFVGHRPQGEKMYPLSPCHPNLYEPSQLKSKKLVLHTKDTLLLCSPGVLHRKNEKGDIFGIKNIIKASNQDSTSGALETRQNVMFSCNEFGKKKPLLKDCTILSLQVADHILRVHKNSSEIL